MMEQQNKRFNVEECVASLASTAEDCNICGAQLVGATRDDWL